MQSFTLSPTNHAFLDKCYRNFLWNKDPSSKAPNIISWDKVCKPKQFGGFGLRNARIDNIAHCQFTG